MRRRFSISSLFPYTTLFRSALNWYVVVAAFISYCSIAKEKLRSISRNFSAGWTTDATVREPRSHLAKLDRFWPVGLCPGGARSEEHTSELQSHSDLVCRLLL